MMPPHRTPRPVAYRPARAALAAAALLLLVSAPPARAQAPGRAGAIETASRATVFLRVFADVDIVVPATPAAPFERTARQVGVEVATGSGFLVSPIGQVLTCQHVVADGERSVQLDGAKARATIKVKRIDVYVPPAPGTGVAPERYEASLIAASAELDVAVLSIPGGGLPAAELGDSDALDPGDGLDALGYPFGREVEIGRGTPESLQAPEISVSHGDFSAFRSDEQGVRRFVQTSAAVNPGSSGGPVLDADGFVVGIVSRRLSGSGTGIGFAVPINLVKDFLETRGLDSQLPVRRLSLGPLQSFEGKGIRIRLPWGMSDTSPLRARVESGVGQFGVPGLHVERLLTPWDALRLADAVSSGRGLELFTPLGAPIQKARVSGGRRLVSGRVTGAGADGSPVRVEYAILDLGQEKLVARFVGTPAQVAFSASVVRASLGSLDGDELRRGTVPAAPPSAWVAPAGFADSLLQQALLPAGWVQEPLPPLACGDLPAATEAVAASPPGDFARTIRAGLVRLTGLAAADASAACGTPLAPGASDYQTSVSWMGATSYVAGRFLQLTEDQFLHLEVVGPADQRAILRALFTAWIARLQGPLR
jgi:S1-C subfamily serine protease